MTTLLSAGRYSVALLCGALMPLGLAPFGWWILALLSAGTLALLLQKLRPKGVFFTCFYYGLGMFGAGVSWVFISINHHGGESIAISTLLTGLFILALTLIFAASFALYGYFRGDSPLRQLLLFPATWVMVEWLRGLLFTGFPWLYLGNSFTDTWLAGWAPIGGVLLLSFIGAFSSAALLMLITGSLNLVRNRPQDASKNLAAYAIATALASLLWLGGIALKDIQWTSPAKSLSVAMVQPALTPSEKWNEDILYDILVQLRDQSAGYWGKDLLIWPESAIPTTPEDVQPFIDYLGELAKESNTTLVTGIPLLKEQRYYNSVILIGADQGAYSKRHLVPFGEYIPLEGLLRGIIKFFDRPMSSFYPGEAAQPLLNAKNTPIATAICYEIVFQDMVAASANDAEMILTLSNDVWFGDSIAPHQHLQMARLRAIENRKPVVRVTNDGISAIIDEQGNISAQMPQFVATTLAAEVTPYTGTTPFNRFRSWPIVIFCLLVGAWGFQTRQRPGAENNLV
ncbi:MAG: apolipoprotein N-acyltransferase [Porticoccaceae bacterium]